MSTVQEIESAITGLPRAEVPRLKRWFDEFAAQVWDARIEEDAANGRLEALYERLESENTGEPEIALGDFLNEEKLP